MRRDRRGREEGGGRGQREGKRCGKGGGGRGGDGACGVGMGEVRDEESEERRR